MRPEHQPDRKAALASASAALVVHADGETVYGNPAALEDLPRNMRRRLSSFDRMAARCVMGLSDPTRPDETIILASSYGNMQLTLDLLGDLCAGELMSPAAFSASVHNAAAGFASVLTGNRGGHVAIAAGADSARAGWIEAWLRLANGADSVLLVIADEPLPGEYAAFDAEADAPAACLAIRLQHAPASDAAQRLDIEDHAGRAGIVSLAKRLVETPVEITCRV